MTFLSFLTDSLSLSYHDCLNPVLWKDEHHLKSGVRSVLLTIGRQFAAKCHIEPSSILDVIMTGGNCNYSYNDASDIDVHLVVDRKTLYGGTMDPKILEDYLQSKKSLWTINHSNKVLGYPVECYVQDADEKIPDGQGIFSLQKDRWIRQPTNLHLNFESDPFLQRKVDRLTDVIDRTVSENHGAEAAKKLKERLKAMRSEGLAKGGEFSRENLTFKALRNAGTLDKLTAYQRSLEDKELSL